jgi:nitrate reductase molybdenum cofactor assembly chaperone NarJ/NarW
MRSMTLTLRVLARLLSYPDAQVREHLADMRDALHTEQALTASRLAEIDTLIERLRSARGIETEAAYVELFDRGRGTALHLFEHVHGDSRDRGPAMVDLIKTYEQAGLYLEPGELPDHLAVVLEYASTQPPTQAREFLREIAHILQVIFSALLRRESGYASVLAAALDLAGEKAQAVTLPEEPVLDETWEEPLAFDGCSVQGQARPGQVQPIQIVRRPTAPAANQLQPGARQ